MQSNPDSIRQRVLAGRVQSVNVGRPRTVQWRGQAVTSAIWKEPVRGPVPLRGVNLDGDDQADRQVHGGPDKAVYAYALDEYREWHEQAGLAAEPGLFGENLTIDGLAVSHARIGERWRIGTALVEVAQPRVPCYKLGIRLGDPGFPRQFAAAERPGAYLRIVSAGVIEAGDDVWIVDRPAHELTAALVARAYHADRSLLPMLLAAPELAPSWRDWAERMLRHTDVPGAATET